jgi:hypothetical protein
VMPQIQAPPDVKGAPTLTPDEKRRLECWPEKGGWCSACGEGKYDDETNVVHMGNRAKGVDFALCTTCIERMRDVLSTVAPTGSVERKEGDRG